MKTLQIEDWIKSENPQLGQSKPLMIIASDQNRYFLKRQHIRDNGNWIEEDAVFFQEYLVSAIANFLGILTPETAIIEVDKQTLKQIPELQFTYQLSEGYYFATKMISNSDENLTRYARILLSQVKAELPYAVKSWNQLMSKIVNKEDIPKIIGLDFFALNFDRFKNPGNLLIRNDPSGRYLIAIDFGHCFGGPFWGGPSRNVDYSPKINTLHCNDINFGSEYAINLLAHQLVIAYNVYQDNGRVKLGFVFDSLISQLDFRTVNPFSAVVDVLESMTEHQILTFLKSIPNFWVVTAGIQQREYKDFLLRQRFIIRPIIDVLADSSLFPNVNGKEELRWSKEYHTNIQ
ncbi:hypothetical protein FAM18132_00911 [Lacticaseibacillus paracasei]|uniref:HipA family kinase n=1 Tax=Lacticaseibacillus paracasei TaxID=1597 RepID=UPI000F0B290D|nr:HipA family kinase [Lacticaseibacillus paracasei]RND38921.1 hypothetical protein FAM18101_01107 [Lacticaseibacillus paracasei]RND46049.1 hypothetical protein FAM18105_00916 [Lacticaseibacillus paracasei]RND72879.1 hypothetical protein FAM18132_00911 [Lacticaseibacillus paracasei]